MVKTLAATELRSLIQRELPEIVSIRRDIHKHPELGFEEVRTSRVVQRELGKLSIPFRAGLAKGTGVVAHLPPSDPGDSHKPSVALRADMDALPILEETGKDYASIKPGVMHACGHDGHTAMLIGAARVLSKVHRPHGITLVFQPAEEGGAGGEKMCEDGALNGEGRGGVGALVGRIYGLHGWPLLPLGTVGTRPGPLLAAVDDFVVTVHGSGGHAAYPHLCADPIVATAHIIALVQTIASRNVGPLDNIVVTIGKIEGGTANNVIPTRASFIGTVRTLRDETRTLAKQRFFAIVENACAALGCRAEIQWHESYPVTHNDPALAEDFLEVARGAVGSARAELVEHPTMGGEDFAYYGRQVPACFFLLGLRPAGQEFYPNVHQPAFDFNDDAIPLGVEMLCRMALHEPMK